MSQPSAARSRPRTSIEFEPGDVGREFDRAGRRVDDAGRADDGEAQARGVDAPGLDQGLAQPADLLDNSRAAAAVGRRGGFGDRRAREIGERRPDLGAAEIDAEHIGGVGLDFIVDRAAPELALGAAARPDPAARLEQPHRLGGRLFGEPGDLGEPGARDRSLVQDRLDDDPHGELACSARSRPAPHGRSLVRLQNELKRHAIGLSSRRRGVPRHSRPAGSAE